MADFWGGFGQGFGRSYESSFESASRRLEERRKLERAAKKEKEKAVIAARAQEMAVKLAGGDARQLYKSAEELKKLDEASEIDPWRTQGKSTAPAPSYDPSSFKGDGSLLPVLPEAGPPTDLLPLLPETTAPTVESLRKDATMSQLGVAGAAGPALVKSLQDKRDEQKALSDRQDKINANNFTNPFGLIDYESMPDEVRNVYESDPKRKSNLELYSRDLTAEFTKKQRQELAYNFEPVAELFRQIEYKDGSEYDFDNMSDREMQYWTSPTGFKQLTDTNEYLAKYVARFGGPPKFDTLNMESKRLTLKEIKDAQSVLKDNKNLDGTPLSEERREAIQRGVVTAQKRLAKLNSLTSYDIEKLKKWVEDFDTNATDEKAEKLYVAKANFTAARPDRQKFKQLINPREFELTVVDESTGDSLFDKVYFEDAVGPDGNPYKVLKDEFRPWLGTFKESIPALVHGGMPLPTSKYIGQERSILYMPKPLIVPPSGGPPVAGGVGGKVPPNRLVGKAFEDYYAERPEMITKLQQLERQKVYRQYGFDLEGNPIPERMIPKTPDPKTPTGMETPTGFTQEELASKAAAGEQTVDAMEEADEVTRDYMLNKEYEPSILEIGDAAFRQDLEARELLGKAAEELTEEENSLLGAATDTAEKLRILEIGLKRLRSK